jgi:hypothetical protein
VLSLILHLGQEMRLHFPFPFFTGLISSQLNQMNKVLNPQIPLSHEPAVLPLDHEFPQYSNDFLQTKTEIYHFVEIRKNIEKQISDRLLHRIYLWLLYPKAREEGSRFLENFRCSD